MMNNIVIALYLTKVFGFVFAIMALGCVAEHTGLVPSLRRWFGGR